MIKTIEDIPGVFLRSSFVAGAELVGVGVLLAVFGSLAYLGLSGDMPLLSIASLVFVFIGIVIGCIIILGLRRSWHWAREYFEYRREIEEMQAEALLREREPQPFIEIERPILVNKPIAVEAADTINDVPIAAVEYFVQQLCRGVPFTQAKWDKLTLPGGYVVASFESYSHLIDPLVELGFIVDRDGERRKSGRLTTTDKDAIMRALREWERGRALKN